jgi:hypothetical protein
MQPEVIIQTSSSLPGIYLLSAIVMFVLGNRIQKNENSTKKRINNISK